MRSKRLEALLLDVRTPAEFEEAHIDGSVLMPLGKSDYRGSEAIGFSFADRAACLHGMPRDCRSIAGLDVPRASDPYSRRCMRFHRSQVRLLRQPGLDRPAGLCRRRTRLCRYHRHVWYGNANRPDAMEQREADVNLGWADNRRCFPSADDAPMDECPIIVGLVFPIAFGTLRQRDLHANG
jgi:hypothetical protein